MERVRLPSSSLSFSFAFSKDGSDSEGNSQGATTDGVKAQWILFQASMGNARLNQEELLGSGWFTTVCSARTSGK